MGIQLAKPLKSSINGAVVILMLIFIVFKIQVPSMIADLVDNVVGIVAIVGVVGYLLMEHPLIGIIAIIAAYELVQRSKESQNTAMMIAYLPTEARKAKELRSYNVFPTTLEEEVVHKMVPYVRTENLPAASFKPVLGNIHDAIAV